MGGKMKIKVKDTPSGADNAPPIPSRKVSITPNNAEAAPKEPVSTDSPKEQVEADSPKSEPATEESSPAAEESSPAAESAEVEPENTSAESEAAGQAESAAPEVDEEAEKTKAEEAEKQEEADKLQAAEAKKQEEADLKEQERLRKEQEKADLKAAKEKEKADKIAQAALLKASMDAATDSETKAFLAQSHSILEDKNVSIAALSTWNEKILLFFAFQRAPYLQKLNNALARVTNGEQALNEAKDWLKFMSTIHGSSGSKLRGVSFFGTDLHKGKKIKAVPELPPSGDSDPSVLALSHLTQLSYNTHEKHALIVDDLKKISDDVNKLTKNYGTKAQKELQKMLQQVKECEDAATDVDKHFKKHCDLYKYYLQAVGSQSATSKLTSGSRKDMWTSEQVYRERVIALTAQHKLFFQQCTLLLEDLHKAEQDRALTLHAVLQEVSNLYVQFYAGMHSVAVAAHASVQSSVQTAVSNYQQQRDQQQQQQLLLATQSAPKRSSVTPTATAAANEKLVKPEPPGPFPTNNHVVLAGSVQMEKGFFKKWKKFYLVLTKDRFLQSYLLDDVDTSGENAEIFGSGTGTFSTTADASKVRFLLKDGKSADGAETWTADGLDCTAEPAPKGDSSFLLKVQPPGLFSSNWDAVVKCDSVLERDMWIKAINENTSPARKAALNVQPPAQE